MPDKSKQNETSIGAAKGSFTLKETLDDGFKIGFDLSKKITKNNNSFSTPNSNEIKKVLMINFGVHRFQKTKIINVL